MKKQKFIAFIPSLLFGLTLAQSVPASAQVLTTPVTTPFVGQSFVSPFIPIFPQAEVFIPLVFASGRSDRPEPGFYHQAILLQKSSINYQNSKSFTIDLGDDKSEVFMFRKPDFQY